MDKIKAKLIIEIMGRPAEHIKQAMTDLVDKLGTEKGVCFIGKTIHDPKQIEKADGFFTSFADLDIEFESITHFFGIIFNYMPAHVEIYDPDKFKIDTFNLNEMANYVITRLHRNEGIMKTLMGEREVLFKQLEHIKNGGKIEDLYPKDKQVQTPKEGAKKFSKKKAVKKTKKKK